MILETIRAITDCLISGSNTMPSGSGSVNYILSNLPLDGADNRPVSMSIITDETRSDIVASGRYPVQLPSLIVTFTDTAKLNGETYSDVRDADISLSIRFIQFDPSVTSNSTADAFYTLKAVQKCLALYMSSDNVSQRIRNNIQIIECLSIEHVPMWGAIEDSVCTGALKYTFRVRDITPSS